MLCAAAGIGLLNRGDLRLVEAAACPPASLRPYVSTMVEQIAERAEVAKPTVFASVGSKRTVLKKLRDLALTGR